MKSAFIVGSTWDALAQHMESHIKERAYEREFFALEWRESEKPKNLTGESLRDVNREKNRYGNILACNSLT